jgi:hypothetical protein
VQPDPTPAEREEMSTQALSDTRERLATIAARLDVMAGAHAALDARLDSAQAAATQAQNGAFGLMDEIRAAKARLLVVAGYASATSAQAAVAELEGTLDAAGVKARDASAHAVDVAERVAAEREALHDERDALIAEQADLGALIAHLEREVTVARAAQGEALLEMARAHMTGLLAAEESARTRLAEAEAAVAAHRVATAEQLAPYPAALTLLAQTALAVPQEPAPAETLIAAHIAFLDALEATGGRLDRPMAGGVALHMVLRSGDGLAAALRGTHPAYVQQLRQVAEVWLAAYRQGLG